MLWKMEFYVEGKHLEKCLESIVDIALNLEVPKPIVNTVIKAGKVKQDTNGGSKLEVLREKLVRNGATPGAFLSSETIHDVMGQVGLNRSSYNYVTTALKKQGFMQPTERRGTMKVL